MMPYKKAAQYFSVLCLIGSFNARADDAICNNANSEIRKLSDNDSLQDTMMGVSPTYQATVADGFLYYGKSGLSFKKNKIVPWGAGDLLVMHPKESDEQIKKGEKNPTKFFIQYDEDPYNGVNDKGTKGGIYKLDPKDQKADSPTISCPTDGNKYVHHFFPKKGDAAPVAGDIYCVRTRTGKEYSLIKVINVCGNGVVFDYKYNRKSNSFVVQQKETSLSHQKIKEAPRANAGKS
ncbi:MAG: hypothetical protein ACXVB4_17770 [Pseudobdellovibrionaceae bacterium]